MYTYTRRKSQEGVLVYELKGPGMPKHANAVCFVPGVGNENYYADRVLQMLRSAFEAGRADKAAEIRKVINGA